MHIIEIYGTKEQLKMIKKILKKYREQIISKNIKIKYIVHNEFIGKLYVNADKIKTIYNPSELAYFFNIPDNMQTREQLLEKCGLPNYNKTSHCFSDSTHHTCCMLGPEARKYADNSGNPIGIASEDAFYLRYGNKPDKLAPWCTCTGSKVCSYYSNKFKDGTHIKFIGDLSTKNEEDGIAKLGIRKHKTPGIL